MFTGIIETSGTILTRSDDALAFSIPDSFEVKLGDSIAVNGACLTVARLDDRTVEADILAETWKRTNLGDTEPGSLVNLERPARVGGHLDGHIVQGHIDGVGTIQSIEESTWGHKVVISVPPEMTKFMVEKGSIAVDGISLTLIDVEKDSFSFEAIPHTWEITNLHTRAVGDRVNLEVDILAKYVQKLLAK